MKTNKEINEKASAPETRVVELELACGQVLQCLKHHFSPHDRNWCIARLEQIQSTTGEGIAPRFPTYREIEEIMTQRDELLAALKLVWNDKNVRLGRDPESNMPISEIIRAAIARAEGRGE